MIVTLAARYAFGMAGPWRPIYVIGAVVSQYLNVFVLVVQLFLKVPALNALAPNGSEPPFAIVQGIVLLLHVGHRLCGAAALPSGAVVPRSGGGLSGSALDFGGRACSVRP